MDQLAEHISASIPEDAEWIDVASACAAVSAFAVVQAHEKDFDKRLKTIKVLTQMMNDMIEES
jgi:hypothetical protein